MSSDSAELIRQVRKIEIKTRGLSSELFAGRYHSAFRGRGMAFSEVREYRPGDDVRDIDWNVTARSRKPHVKVYEEERELTMMLLADVSPSGAFGTVAKNKRAVITEIAAVLAFSASENNDKVGCLLFSDRVEKFVPPKKGRQHVLSIIRELLDFKAEGTGTDLSVPVAYLTNALKKRCTAFLLSDFIAPESSYDSFEDALRIASGKHDMVALKVYDPRDAVMPDIGPAEFRDAETGRKLWVDTSSRSVREAYAGYRARCYSRSDGILKRCRVDSAAVPTDEDYVKSLIKLFKRR